jgi:hypothetical protein
MQLHNLHSAIHFLYRHVQIVARLLQQSNHLDLIPFERVSPTGRERSLAPLQEGKIVVFEADFKLTSGSTHFIMTYRIVLLVVFSSVAVRAQTPQKPCPCCYPEARQFDFWIGEWETYTPQGKLAGTNSIVVMQDSCLLQENWNSNGSPYSGTSYNFYNPGTRKWQQVWLDNQGGNLLLEGTFENGRMILTSGELPNREQKLQIDRITWTPNKDGTVRQLWEITTDKGKNWTVVFDGLYKRLK